jgi:hypothetical protein
MQKPWEETLSDLIADIQAQADDLESVYSDCSTDLNIYAMYADRCKPVPSSAKRTAAHNEEEVRQKVGKMKAACRRAQALLPYAHRDNVLDEAAAVVAAADRR